MAMPAVFFSPLVRLALEALGGWNAAEPKPASGAIIISVVKSGTKPTTPCKTDIHNNPPLASHFPPKRSATYPNSGWLIDEQME